MDGFFFFFSILFCSQTSYDSQEGLVKFDYGPNMKVEKFKNNFIFWLFSGTCCRNLAILFLFLNLANQGHLSNKNPSYVSKFEIIFFRLKKYENLPPEKTLANFYHIFYLYKGISMKNWPEFARFSPKFSKSLEFCDKFQYVGKNIERFFVSTFISRIQPNLAILFSR